MSFVAHITRSLFPKDTPRPARQRAAGGQLSHLFAVTCALTPLAAVVHAMRETV